MTTENEEWILDTYNHVSNPELTYAKMNFFQGILFSNYFFSIVNHNDYIQMADFTLLP